MRTKIIGAAVLAVALLGGGLSAYKFALAGDRRAADPVDTSRLDCPGQVVCPITGELVCRDRCPLGGSTAQPDEVPSCCRSKE